MCSISDHLGDLELVDEINFDKYKDYFRGLSIHMAIICDLQQGGKMTEKEAFIEIKKVYKQFKSYHKQLDKESNE